MATDEYVPTIVPTTSAKEKPAKTWPPNMKSEKTARNVIPDVMMVLFRV